MNVIGKCPFCIEEHSDGQEFNFVVKEIIIDGVLDTIERSASCTNCQMIFVQSLNPEDEDDCPEYLPTALQFEQPEE